MESDEVVSLVHALPRRARLRVPALVGRAGAGERVARALSRERPRARITVRPATGSVIVEGEAGAIDAGTLVARLTALLAEERDEAGRPLTALRPEHHPGPTRVARAVAHAVAGINGDVRAGLDHHADLGTLLPVFFAVAGLVEVGVTGRLPAPTWFNLLWWSLRSFMTFNVTAVEEELRGEGGANGHASAAPPR